MTQKPEENRTVTVAELLARNGQVSGTSGRAHRRRARDGGISVAELTGEIPVIREPEAVAEEAVEQVEAEEAVDAEVVEPEEPEADEPAAEEEPSEEEAAEDEAVEDEPVEDEPAAKSAPESEAEQTRAYSAFDAATDAGPQSPREFASTASFPVMTPLASSVMNADAEEAALPEADAPELDAAELETTESGTAEPEAAVGDAPVSNKSALRQWLVLGLQAAIGVVVGAALFVGFERLWEKLPYVALVLAILAIVAMVAVVRILRKTDDIVSVLLAVVVGVIVTIGPLAFVLSTS